MRATFNSMLVLAAFAVVFAMEAANFRGRVQAAYKTTKEAYQTDPSSSNAIAFARACFDAAEFARDNDERESYATDGIGVALKLAQQQPRLAAAHYYLAMNYGQLARVKQFSALKLVDMIETSLKKAKSFDSKYDFAGPDRGLGLLYRDAPGWPLSLGDKAKARTHLKAAVRIAPSFPENLLNLLEAHVKWDEEKTAREQLAGLEKQWDALKRQFEGPHWEPAWADWERRLREVKEDLD